jgi:hypothetical protein
MEFTVKLAYMEIYMEKVKDLLERKDFFFLYCIITKLAHFFLFFFSCK